MILSGSRQVSFAQSVNAYDIIAAANAVRANEGLEPYQVDDWLMQYAQEHSEYQASLQTGTHIHSDGTLPLALGLQENVAGVMVEVATADVVVNKIWVDWGHRHTITGYVTGSIGAGVALSDNGQVYFTIDVRPGDEVGTVPTPAPPLGTVDATAGAATTTPFVAPISNLKTSVPNEDGSIVHIVSYGETLWSIAIAYGVTVNDIRRLNGMAVDNTAISIGQKLLIRPARTATPTLFGEPSASPTEALTQQATRPLKASQVAAMASLSSTNTALPPTPDIISTPAPLPVSTATTSPILLGGSVPDNRTTVIVLVLLMIIMLFPLVIFSFRAGDDHKTPGR